MTDSHRWHGLIILDGLNDPVIDPPLPEPYRPHLIDLIPELREDPTGADVLRAVQADVSAARPGRRVVRVGVSGALRDDRSVLNVQSVRHVYWTAGGAYQLGTHRPLRTAGALQEELGAQRRTALAVILSDLPRVNRPVLTDELLIDGELDGAAHEGLPWLTGRAGVTPRARILIEGSAAPTAGPIRAGLRVPHPPGAITVETHLGRQSGLVHSVIVAASDAPDLAVNIPVPAGASGLLVMAAFDWTGPPDEPEDEAEFLGACAVPVGPDGQVFGDSFTRTGPRSDDPHADTRRKAALLDAATRHVHLLGEYGGDLSGPDTHVTYTLNTVRRLIAPDAGPPLRA